MTEQNNDDSNPNEIIPISFDMYKILEDNLENFCDDKYLKQTQSQAKSSGIKLLEVHGVEKSLNPNLRPEKTAYFSQTRKFGEATNRSRKSQIKEEET